MPEQQTLFHEVFLEHLKAGTYGHGKLSSRWKDEAFASEVGCTVRALGYWKRGERAPSQAVFNRIVKVLFGENPAHPEASAKFTAAWQARTGSQKRAPARPAKQPPQRSAPDGRTPAEWVAQEPFVLRDELGRLTVLNLGGNQASDPDGSVALNVTAETGRVSLTIPKTEDTEQFTAIFAVTSAWIVVVREMNVSRVEPTTLGTPNLPHPGVVYAGAWYLKVPLANDGEAGGIVLAGETLRQYRVAREGEPFGVRLELRCRDVDLTPIGATPPPGISEKQRAILHRILQYEDADSASGTIVLAGDELFRSGS